MSATTALTNPSTNALGDTPPTVCPVCAGPCTFPGEGPTGQLGGLCTVCGWDYLTAGVRTPYTSPEPERIDPRTGKCPLWCMGDHHTILGDDDASVVTVHRHVTTDADAPYWVAAEVWQGEGEGSAGVYVESPNADNLTPEQARAFAAALIAAADVAAGVER